MTRRDRTLLGLSIVAVCWGFAQALLVFHRHPSLKLPPEGERHTWQITWLDTNGAVLVTEPYPGLKIQQVFYSDTAYPRRRFGTNWHEVNHKIVFSGKDPEDGSSWTAVMVENPTVLDRFHEKKPTE